MLAGQELLFEVEVIATREATLEEIAHGHLHQEGGYCCGDTMIVMKKVMVVAVVWASSPSS